MKFAIGEMTVGDIIDRGIKLLFGRFGTLYTLNFLLLLPLLAAQLIVPAVFGDPGLESAAFAALGLAVLLQPIGTAATLRVVEQEFAGRHIGLGEALRYALGRFAALLGTTLLFALLVFGVTMACLVPGIVVASAPGGEQLGLVVLIMGGIALVVLAALLLTWFAFLSQTVVVERLSGSRAMQRSKSLTEGYRGRVFGVLLLIYMIVQLGTFVAASLNFILPGMTYIPRTLDEPKNPFDPGIPVISDWNYFVVNTVIAYLVQIIGSTFFAIATTLLYFDLRIRKEGYDLEVAALGGEDQPDFDLHT